MATPSSKQNPGATPTHLTSSPRPSGAPHMARPLSHKSPSTRTPSASGHGHNYQPSTSSHQYATPLAATAGIDDPVTFSSPSALLALGGYTGISPSPAAHDGLVGPGMNENDIQALGMSGIKLGGARDNDEERRRHIEDVVQLLRTRVAGRGVCREGIERLGQLEGFESIWQEDSINIAGNFVDLEIEFYPGQNAVKDVTLAYVSPEAPDGGRREEATAVLKRDLIQTPEEREKGAWKPLNGFHENLRWLAKLDKLSQEVNCFEAIEGLYASLKRIWDKETQQSKFAGTYEHLSCGWVGRPCLHKGGRVGVALDYWVPRPRMLDAKLKASPDAMVVDQPANQCSDEKPEHESNIWSMKVECEEGYPSLRVSKDWVGSEVLTAANANEQPSSSSNTLSESETSIVNWNDPPPTFASVNGDQNDPMALDSGMLGSPTPNRRFVAKLEPPVDVPILAASDIYRHLGIQLPQEFKMVTYDGLLVPGWSPLSPTEPSGIAFEEPMNRGKRRLSVDTFDSDGKQCKKQHSYTFQSFESVAGRTLRDIPFSHPRQLSEILPILRQYASLASIIRKTFMSPSAKSKVEKPIPMAAPDDTPDVPKFPSPGAFATKNTLIVLSNDDPNEEKLNSLLNGFGANGSSSDSSSIRETLDSEDDVKVDVTLRTQLGQAPVIMLLFTVNNRAISSPATIAAKHGTSRISISFEIGLNGRISVVDSTGLWEEEQDAGGDMHALDDQKHEALETEKRIARVLEVSHDLGILVEWVLRWLRQRKRSA